MGDAIALTVHTNESDISIEVVMVDGRFEKHPYGLPRSRKGNCDDVLLVQRGHVTDTSYANVALFDGSNWYTPAWPLLRGTRREKLIENGTLKASVIRERDLHNFQTLRLVNAMLPWGAGPELAMDKVYR